MAFNRAIQSLILILILPALLALAILLRPARPIVRAQPRTFPSHCRWTSTPCLVIGPSVDNGFAHLAAQTWDTFLATFSPLASCLPDVHLHASYTLPARAGYDPAAATVTVRVPGSAARLRAALVHEWAHHLEFQCPQALAPMRPAFLAAEGFSPDTPWRPQESTTTADRWADIPSEHFAEAAIELVLGHNATPTQIHVRPEAIQVMRAWLSAGQSTSIISNQAPRTAVRRYLMKRER